MSIERLQRLSPDQLDRLIALAAASGTTAAESRTPKFSRALDTVPADKVRAVVDACRAALDAKTVEGVTDDEREAARMAPLERVAPHVASAARANSVYRGKPIEHSLAVAIRYLEEKRLPAANGNGSSAALEAEIAQLRAAVARLEAKGKGKDDDKGGGGKKDEGGGK